MASFFSVLKKKIWEQPKNQDYSNLKSLLDLFQSIGKSSIKTPAIFVWNKKKDQSIIEEQKPILIEKPNRERAQTNIFNSYHQHSMTTNQYQKDETIYKEDNNYNSSIIEHIVQIKQYYQQQQKNIYNSRIRHIEYRKKEKINSNWSEILYKINTLQKKFQKQEQKIKDTKKILEIQTKKQKKLYHQTQQNEFWW